MCQRMREKSKNEGDKSIAEQSENLRERKEEVADLFVILMPAEDLQNDIGVIREA